MMAWNFMHKRGCGGVVFTYHGAKKPKPTDYMADTVLNCTYPDGSQVNDTDLEHCGTCGAGLSYEDLRLEFFEEVRP